MRMRRRQMIQYVLKKRKPSQSIENPRKSHRDSPALAERHTDPESSRPQQLSGHSGAIQASHPLNCRRLLVAASLQCQPGNGV